MHLFSISFFCFFFLELKLFSTTLTVFLWCVILCNCIFFVGWGGGGVSPERDNYGRCGGFDLRDLIRDDW